MKPIAYAIAIATLFAASSAQSAARARDYGIQFDGKTGEYNAITDVPGVEVGHSTLISGEGAKAVRTGVTAVLPAGKTKSKVPAAIFSLNGNGEMTGSHWIEESGFLEGPVMLTNTFSVGLVRDAVRKWGETKFPNKDPEADDAFMLPVVAETYDGYLNDIKGHHVAEEHVFEALNSAERDIVAEGSVGGGTGMICFEFKCGIGTSSRIADGYVVGVLVQANFGERSELMVRGRALGKQLSESMPEAGPEQLEKKKDGSIIVVVATNAPLLPSQLKRLAKRATLGLARTGSTAHNSSGDIFIAFSTQAPLIDESGTEVWLALSNEEMDALFRATVESTEEAILNALVAGETMVGLGDTKVYGIPRERLSDLYNNAE